jgi:8-oxo-dGTP pyrophosphatase MutT (NUDIX family)
MWIFTTIGFFSIVQKPGSEVLTVRARAKGDLDALRARYLPSLSRTTSKGGSDYPWRATVDHAAFAEAMKQMVLNVTYSNYKSAVANIQGHARARVYHDVWAALLNLPEAVPKTVAATESRPPIQTSSSGSHLSVAYGGVVMRSDRSVLLREPRKHFDGYVWTFAKGRPNPGEAPESAALREVLEETGVKGRILAPIEGDFAGGTTLNRYFLMAEEHGGTSPEPHDQETASLRWAKLEEAQRLIRMTTNSKGRERDLAVLAAAVIAWETWGGGAK